MENKKKCFIITPIGSESDPIRRHIEGIIEAAIRPALGTKYELVVAHKIYEPGSITKQVISEIYNDELVIANLTNRNPNVMYELAFRHSLGKPAIMIAESGTSLPADIIMERVIFYQNDAQGILDLIKALGNAESKIDFSKIDSPIYDVIHSIDQDKKILQVSQDDVQTGQEVLPYILDKLNKLEDLVLANRASSNTSFQVLEEWVFEFPFSLSNNIAEEEGKANVDIVSRKIFDIPEISTRKVENNYIEKNLTVYFSAPKEFSFRYLLNLFRETFSKVDSVTFGNPEVWPDY